MNPRLIYRIGSCLYLFNALVTLWSDGWRSLYWAGWLLMAVAFFAFSQLEVDAQTRLPWRMRMRSPAFLTGCIAMIVGAGLIVRQAALHH
jgi:hypothetical protein